MGMFVAGVCGRGAVVAVAVAVTIVLVDSPFAAVVTVVTVVCSLWFGARSLLFAIR